jgi:predicted lipoprotein with Yx(FWY)xxD motif
VRLRTTAAGSRPSSRWIAAPVLALTALAATGGTASATSYWSSPPRYPTNTSATATMSAAQVTVQTKNNAELGTILADGQGLTLYTLTNNGSPVLCSGACTMFWPPLVVAAGMPPTPGAGVTGLGSTTNANGDQVTDNGLPLYRYGGDSSPSEANGDGIMSFGGVWHVVTAAAPTAPSTSTTTSSTTTTSTTTTASPSSSASASTSASPTTTSPSTTSSPSITVARTATITVPLSDTTTTPSARAVTGPTVATQAPTGSADPQAAGRTNLPTTGHDVGLNVMLGVVLIAVGLVLATAAHRRGKLERLAWPDER